jgi:hypothetical protein
MRSISSELARSHHVIRVQQTKLLAPGQPRVCRILAGEIPTKWVFRQTPSQQETAERCAKQGGANNEGHCDQEAAAQDSYFAAPWYSAFKSVNMQSGMRWMMTWGVLCMILLDCRAQGYPGSVHLI